MVSGERFNGVNAYPAGHELLQKSRSVTGRNVSPSWNHTIATLGHRLGANSAYFRSSIAIHQARDKAIQRSGQRML